MFKLVGRGLFFLCGLLIAGFVIGAGVVFAQSSSFASFKEDLDFVRSQSAAVLLFTPLGSNPDPTFAKHALTVEQLHLLCGQTADCGNLGINFATMFKKGQYDKLKELGMHWALEIAEKGREANAASAINENPDARIIVRIGVSGNSGGFADYKGNAEDYIAFLKNLSGMVGGKEFYAIAGPNEPDIEKWIAPECGSAPGTESADSQKFYDCIGPKLSSYMNAVCAANLPSNIKLLTPAFNMTSYTFTGIVQAMDKAGANWGCFAKQQTGFAGNLYPAGKSMKAYWNDEYTGKTIQFLQSKGLKVYITETSAFSPLSSQDVNTIPHDFSEFYIHPILGLTSNKTLAEGKEKDAVRNAIRDDLIRQGYEARCAAPGFNIELSQAGIDWMKKYLLCRDDGKCNDGDIGDGAIFGGVKIDQFTETMNENTSIGQRVVSILTTDYRESLIPVFRDVDRVPQLKRSLEDFYGYKETSADQYNLAELKSSAINSLLSTNQRCTQSALSLLQRDEMCKKLQDPSTCALYDTKVPDTNLTMKELLDAYTAYSGTSTDHEANCSKITAGTETELRKGMLNLPLHIDNAYRLAFLITSIRTKVPITGDMMNLFQHPHRGELNESPDPPHVVIVSAFKVPDITTNKGTITGDSASGHTDFNDPAMLTRDVLIPSTIKQELDKRGDQERKRLLDTGRVVGAQPQDDTTMEIQCEIKGVGGQQCKDPLTRALLDIINTQAVIEKENKQLVSETGNESIYNQVQKEQMFKLDCDDAPTEEPAFIFDPGELQPLDNPGRIFKADFGVALLENLFTDQSHLRPGTFEYDPTYADTESNKKDAPGGFHWGLKSVFHVVAGNTFGDTGTKRAVKHFLVYPEGYDLKTIEAVMSGTFFTSQQIVALRDKALKYQRFNIKDDKVVFEGGSISSGTITDFTVKDDGRYCDTEYYDAEGKLKHTDPCPTGSFSFTLFADKEPKHAGILGGRLGFWTHTIQQTLQRSQALTHKYLENCTSTEDFLLDQCGGATTSLVATDEDKDEAFDKLTSFTITYWNGSEVTFYPPNRELWDAIVSASNQHGCDPWLVLATAHSESITYTNAGTPTATGGMGIFNLSPQTWEKWKTANNSSANADHHMSSCDFWQPLSFSSRTMDFSSPTNIRAAVDTACRRILWTGAQRNNDVVQEFTHDFSSTNKLHTPGKGDGVTPDGEIWSPSVKQADYVFRLWNELLTRTSESAKSQPSGYPYDVCTGQAPKVPPAIDTGTDTADYNGRTTLPATGEATYYSPGVMNQVLNYRETAEINRSLVDTCEIASSGSLKQQFDQLQAEAMRNGTGKFVGCAAMLRLGDVRFRENRDINDVRVVWIQRPPGAPSDIPDVIGPIAIIDVAASVDYPRLRNKGWIIDLDYHTFRRLFEWQGSWRRPQQGIRVCDTREQCALGS